LIGLPDFWHIQGEGRTFFLLRAMPQVLAGAVVLVAASDIEIDLE
jgi:hypothetical protein